MLNRAKTFFRSLVDIRPGEGWMTLLMSINLFLIITTFAVVKPARSSLFLQEYGARMLPYVYIATALLAGLVVYIHSRLLRRFSPLRVQYFTYLFFASNLLLFWWAFQAERQWLPAAFYLWVNIFTITSNTLFWILANTYHNAREAKRLYGPINSAGTVGGILSGVAVAQLVTRMGTENLLLVTAGILGLGIAVTYLISRQGRSRFAAQELTYVGEERDTEGDPAEQEEGALKSPYPRAIAGALALALTVSVIIEFQFNVVVEQSFPLKDAKTAFFSSFFAGINLVTFILQFFLTGALLRRMGIGFTLTILPVLMLAGSALFPFFPGLAAAIFLRLSDGSVRYSVEQSTRDVLYLPIPRPSMVRFKAFVDVFVQRLAKGIGSILVLLLTSWLAFGFEVLSYLTFTLALVWLFVAFRLRRHYMEELRRFLRRGRFQDEDRLVQYLDQKTTEELLLGLESEDGGKALYSLELLEQSRTVDLRMVLRNWVRSRSAPLQAQALRHLAEVGDPSVVAEAEKILGDQISEATEEAIHYLCATNAEGPLAKMQEILQIPDPGVRAAALACQVNHGGAEGQTQVCRALEEMIRQTGPQGTEDHLLAARTLENIRPPSTMHSLLAPLLQKESPVVVRAALEAAGKVLRRDLVSLVIQHLSDPKLSSAALEALKAHGDTVLGTLSDYFDDPNIPIEIRCRLPAVFAASGSPKGVRALMDHLGRGEARMRYAVVKALDSVGKSNGGLRIREEMVRSAIRLEATESYRLLGELFAQPRPGKKLGEQVNGKSDKIRRDYRLSLHIIFRLLSLIYSGQDILTTYRSLWNSRLEVRAGAVEFLDNLLPSTLRRWILPLVDDSLSLNEKLQAGAALTD